MDDGCIKAAEKLAHVEVSKGSAACLSVLGASVLEKNVIWELGLLLLLFSVWLHVWLESSSDLQCVMTSRLKLIPYFTLF